MPDPPDPHREKSLEERDRRHFDQIAEAYARKDRMPSTRVPREYQVWHCVQPILNQRESLGTIVEVGCGVGRAAKYLRGRYDRYIGIDQSRQLIEAARAFNADCPAEFICANIKAPDLPRHVADLVILIGALHHMTEIDVVMDALCRLAKPAAWLAAFEPNNGNPVFQLLRRLRQRVDPHYSAEQRFFAPHELDGLLRRHGFTEIDLSFQGFCSPPFAEVVLRPQAVFAPLSRLATGLDRLLDGRRSTPWRLLSWNLVARARFPQ